MSKKLLSVQLCALASLVSANYAQAEDAAPSSISGWLDETISNDYITPRGLLESDKGISSYFSGGLAVQLYHNPGGPVSDISVHGGALFNNYSEPSAGTSGNWREFDWWAGTTLTLDGGTTFGVEYSQFASPKEAYNADNNIEFSVTGGPIQLSKLASVTPYAKLFWNEAGTPVVVTGQRGAFDVELGFRPSLDFNAYDVPLTLTIPTWVTVGPSNFWGGGGNFGVFSTGVVAKTPLSFIPKKFGAWYLDGGVQYYRELNDRLLLAQQELGVSRERDVVAASAGLGFSF